MATNGVTIIKRKRAAAAPARHGGAWKVAYADFVTAMMAFFMLMWLLNATTEEQRAGIAEYFDPRVPIAKVSGGGSSAFGGDSIFSEKTMSQNGTGASARSATDDRQARGERGVSTAAEERRDGVEDELAALDNLFRGMSGESEAADELLRHIRTRITDEGLVIELFDVDGVPLFVSGTAQPTRRMRELLRMVGRTAALVTNRVAIEGRAGSARPRAGRASNWELSADRGNAARRALTASGVDGARMDRVTGRTDGAAAQGRGPGPSRRHRVAITLLRSDLRAPL